MNATNVVPLLLAVVLVTPIAITRVHVGADRALARLALVVFGDYVDEFREEHPDRQAALRAAHVPQTYREYGSKTMLYATTFAVVGSILGIYVVWAVLVVLSIDVATLRDRLPTALEFLSNLGGLPSLTPLELAVLVVCSSLTLGVAAGGAAYWLRWWYPSYVASERARRIDASLPRTVAFVHALSKSGMEFSEITRIVAENGDTYGAAAAEFDVAVRNVDTFGMDVITAVQTMGRRTASPQFREFCENLVSVLQSGHSLSAFLERQYHDYQEEAEAQQESMLGLLATLAEAYVTVLVAGPLFLITILVGIGFSLGETLDPLVALVYLILPFGNLAFVVYLATVTDSIGVDRTTGASPAGPAASIPASIETQRSKRADGGVEGSVSATHPNVERVRIYRRLRWIRRRLASPLETVVDRPEWLLAVTIPIAVGAIGRSAWGALGRGPGLELAAIDDAIALSVLFVVGTFAVVYERHRARVRAIEGAVPDFLDRLASVNEAGMPIVSAIGQVRQSNLGALDAELDRVWTDVQWGADLQTALRRLEARVRTRSAARVVTLLTEAMNASGNLATVLRIASRQAAVERRLQRARTQAMLEYMVVVYVSFLVFLFIVAVLTAYLLPAIPGESVTASNGATDAVSKSGLGGSTDFDVDAYTQLFYHAALLQGGLSGFIAGQLSTGDVKAGAKHAALMIAVAYLLFTFVI